LAAEDYDAGPRALLQALMVPRFFLRGLGFLGVCYLIVARFAEFNSLLPRFLVLYFSVRLLPDSFLK
jgi:hypothetical protein